MTVSESFPSYFSGKNQDRRVIEVSYRDQLAQSLVEKTAAKWQNTALFRRGDVVYTVKEPQQQKLCNLRGKIRRSWLDMQEVLFRNKDQRQPSLSWCGKRYERHLYEYEKALRQNANFYCYKDCCSAHQAVVYDPTSFCLTPAQA